MYAIRNSITGLLFSRFSPNQDFSFEWDNDDPWVYSRECDALFVLSETGMFEYCTIVKLKYCVDE